MLFETHAHLNFQTFDGNVAEIIKQSQKFGIRYINVVGTDIESSRKAVNLAETYEGVFATVGIHPHHLFNLQFKIYNLQKNLEEIEKLLDNPKVIGVGETGMDRHVYKNTRYKKYEISDRFIKLQEQAFEEQIKLALKYQKSLVLHNREAIPKFLEILDVHLGGGLARTPGDVEYTRAVFHCCEPDQRLLDFAIKHKIYIGIDGDVTYDKSKQDFVKKIPLELLVLETDSPFLTPKGLNPPNSPSNLNVILEFIAKILKVEKEKLGDITFKNSENLFGL